jgi:hypothetical protein
MPQLDLNVANYLGEAAEFLVMFLVEVFNPESLMEKFFPNPFQIQLVFVWLLPKTLFYDSRNPDSGQYIYVPAVWVQFDHLSYELAIRDHGARVAKLVEVQWLTGT